jgi:hypothetical protein
MSRMAGKFQAITRKYNLFWTILAINTVAHAPENKL